MSAKSADALIDQSKFEEAVTAYRQAINISPSNAEAHYNLGNALKEQDKLDDVAMALVEVTALTPPRSSTPHVELLCYRGRFDRGSPSVRPACREKPCR